MPDTCPECENDELYSDGCAHCGYGHKDMFVCPQCGQLTETLDEGYCPECSADNRAKLHAHNFEYDRWQKLTPEQREAEIRSAARNA